MARPPNIHQLLHEMRRRFRGFRPRASPGEIELLVETLGPLPESVLDLYRDHDGASAITTREGEERVTVRLMPIDEAIEISADLELSLVDEPKLGPVAWLWSDDTSDWMGVYTGGPLRGWLFKWCHENINTSPAYRCVEAFLERWLGSAADVREEPACDLSDVPRELPVMVDDPATVEGDRALMVRFVDAYEKAADHDFKRFFGLCAMAVTPVADTRSLSRFFDDPDMWTPKDAVELMEIRRAFRSAEELEEVVMRRNNAFHAALRALARDRTHASDAALGRLARVLGGEQLEHLEQYVRLRDRLLPPQWG